jgi:threonyl-tRNA synthetase
VRVLPITDRALGYGKQVRDACAAASLRVTLDERGEKIGAKIRDAQLQKVPYMLVLGDREAAEGTWPSARGREATWGRSPSAISWPGPQRT